jgi:hypothetical protein
MERMAHIFGSFKKFMSFLQCPNNFASPQEPGAPAAGDLPIKGWSNAVSS